MAIKNLTDISSQSYYPRLLVGIRVYKGDKKPEKGIGKDLEDKFRIECKNETINNIIKKHYGSMQPKSINVYLPYPDIDRCFPSTMESYNASGVEFRCDGDRIYEETTQVEQNGHIYRQKNEVDKPCLADGLINRCPKCQKTGRLVFCIKEVFDSGFVNQSGMLTVHSFTDLTALTAQLSRHLQLMSSLCASPFPSPLTNGFIPFVLSRTQVDIKRPVLDKANGYKRSGKYADGVAYAVSLDIDPEWLSAWMKWQQVEQIQALGMTVNPLALKGFWSEDLVLSSQPPVKALKSADTVDDPEGIKIWETFLDLLKRANSIEQVQQAKDWLRSPARWQKIQHLPSIERKIENALIQAEERLIEQS